MSKLADLLNPAPSSVPSSATHHRPSPISVPPTHRRNESITSPLEALALAATTAPPLQTSPTAVAPPPSAIPPNPYAIKSHFSPPPASTAYSHPPPANPYATSPPQLLSPQRAPVGLAHADTYPPPATVTASLAEQQTLSGSKQAVVKMEATDDPAGETAALPIKSEQQVNNGSSPIESTLSVAAPSQLQEATMKEEGSTTEIKPSVEATPTPVPEPVKRPSQKKGMAKKVTTANAASKKSAPKKRKLEPESSKDGTPFSQRSDTPASRVSKTAARKNTSQQSSPPPSQDNASVADEDVEGGDYVDENEVFCVCRKPDDHTWMIGCDGGCDDWFHGHCINVRETDSDLIDKFVCPNCEKAGRGTTLWKRMCRLGGCRKPARPKENPPSKYCSDDHGRQFMRDKVYGKNGSRSSKEDNTRKRRKQDKVNGAADAEAKYDDASSDDGHQAHLRGGVIRPGELKALVDGSKSFEQFRKLGERIATPEKTENAADDDGDVKMADGDPADDDVPKLQYTEEDQAKIDQMSRQREKLESQLRMLSDKEKFLNMVKTRHKSVLEELKKKEGVKDICGYDARLTWSEPEFDDWRISDEGKQALESKALGPPPKKQDQDGGSANGSAKEDDADEIGRGMCKKKKCERHKQWAKQEQNEINLARSQTWHLMRKLEGEEASVKERAMLRQLETATA